LSLHILISHCFYASLENSDSDHADRFIKVVAFSMLPELLAMVSSDLFLVLSLLACLLDDKVPKALPYIFQIAALSGFGHLLVSRMFMIEFDETMRYWYNVFYLGVALTSIVAVNVYLATSKKDWTLAKVWSGTVTFPALVISMLSVYSFGYLQGPILPPLLPPLLITFSCLMLAATVGVLLGSKFFDKSRRR